MILRVSLAVDFWTRNSPHRSLTDLETHGSFHGTFMDRILRNLIFWYHTVTQSYKKTSTYGWTLDDIRIEKIISAPIWAFCTFYLYYYLDIVPSYHPMQFKGKLMNQTWGKSKKPNFGPNFGLFWPKFGLPKNFLVGFTSTRCFILLQAIIVFNFFFIWLRQSLDIIVSYHHVQYQKKDRTLSN